MSGSLTPEEIAQYEQEQDAIYRHHKDLVFKEYYRTLERQTLKLNLELGNVSNVPKQIVDLYEQKQKLLEQKNKRTQKNYIGFFTINARQDLPEVILHELHKSIEQFLKKTWVYGEVYYTFEQRGEVEKDSGKGIHLHILFRRNGKRPYNAKIETYNTFKKIYGKGKKQSKTLEHDYKFYPNSFWEDKIAYMDGTAKWDEEKHAKQKIDKIFRNKYKLKPIYKVDVKEEEK